MLSQQNLIYLGIALLIVGIAFFAYQELQKHHTEIEKLRMQSQKLEKIIHAYNMRQWHQSTDPYLNDGAADSDDESNETDESTDEDENENGDMTSFIRQTLNSIGTPAGPSKVTISAGGKTVQFPVTPQPQITFSQKEDGDDIPDVDTFDIGRNNKNEDVTGNGGSGGSGSSGGEGGSNAGEEEGENLVGNFGGDSCKERGDGDMYEMEQNDIDINDDEKKNGETTICQVRIRKGERKGEICGSAAKAKGMCLRHYRETNKIH